MHKFRSLLHWMGGGLAIGGIWFVVVRFREYGAEIDLGRLDARVWQTLLISTLIYGGANLFLALAWRDLLGFLGDLQPRRWAVRVYGLSQIAKYLPGNIFHLAGRQALGVANGASGWPLAKSTAWELGLIAVTGALFGLLVLPMAVPRIPVVVAVALFALIMAGSMWMLGRRIASMVTHAFCWHMLYLGLSGLIFLALVATIAGSLPGPELAGSIIGAYVLAWLAGLVTPGAPAGVGVRELVLLALLGAVVEPPVLLMAIALGRMVTVSGDVLFFLSCAAMPAQRVTPGAANAE